MDKSQALDTINRLPQEYTQRALLPSDVSRIADGVISDLWDQAGYVSTPTQSSIRAAAKKVNEVFAERRVRAFENKGAVFDFARRYGPREKEAIITNIRGQFNAGGRELAENGALKDNALDARIVKAVTEYRKPRRRKPTLQQVRAPAQTGAELQV